jgi:quercetin dioxygenase-like cupin family protein
MKMTAAMCRAAGLAFFVLFTTVAHAQGEPLKPARILPDHVVWSPSPLGFQIARIAGDPTKAGMYANRVRFPAGLRIQPHFHPDERIVVVLSGTVYFSYGEQFDEAGMKALSAGSVWTEPARQPHFAWAKDGEAVIQVIGNGPSGTTPIQPKQ